MPAGGAYGTNATKKPAPPKPKAPTRPPPPPVTTPRKQPSAPPAPYGLPSPDPWANRPNAANAGQANRPLGSGDKTMQKPIAAPPPAPAPAPTPFQGPTFGYGAGSNRPEAVNAPSYSNARPAPMSGYDPAGNPVVIGAPKLSDAPAAPAPQPPSYNPLPPLPAGARQYGYGPGADRQSGAKATSMPAPVGSPLAGNPGAYWGGSPGLAGTGQPLGPSPFAPGGGGGGGVWNDETLNAMQGTPRTDVRPLPPGWGNGSGEAGGGGGGFEAPAPTPALPAVPLIPPPALPDIQQGLGDISFRQSDPILTLPPAVQQQLAAQPGLYDQFRQWLAALGFEEINQLGLFNQPADFRKPGQIVMTPAAQALLNALGPSSALFLQIFQAMGGSLAPPAPGVPVAPPPTPVPTQPGPPPAYLPVPGMDFTNRPRGG